MPFQSLFFFERKTAGLMFGSWERLADLRSQKLTLAIGVMRKIAEYRTHSEKCRELANLTRTPADKHILEGLARSFATPGRKVFVGCFFLGFLVTMQPVRSCMPPQLPRKSKVGTTARIVGGSIERAPDDQASTCLRRPRCSGRSVMLITRIRFCVSDHILRLN